MRAYESVVSWIKKVGYNFDLTSLNDDVEGIIDKIKEENAKIGKGFSFRFGQKSNFVSGVGGELLNDSDYQKGREDLIQDAAEDIFDEPSKFQDYINEIKQKNLPEDEIKIQQIKMRFGAEQANEERYEISRQRARDLTWEKIESSAFVRSLKAGKITSSFNEQYKLEPSEGDEIQRRLHEEYLEKEAKEEEAKKAEKQAELERKAIAEAVAKEEEKAVGEAIEEL